MKTHEKTLSFSAAISLFCGLALFSALVANAEKVPGNAPFINTWLVSGTFDRPEADLIYGIDSIPRPKDGNWASLATATASSVWQSEAIGFPHKSSDASSPALAIDGKKETDWISQMHDTNGGPDSWPAWDPAPALYLDWNTPVKVKEVQIFDRHNPAWKENVSHVEKVICTLKDKKGNKLDSAVITNIDPSGIMPGKAVFTAAVQNVSRVELLIVHDGKKEYRNVGLGFKEVIVLDGDPATSGDDETLEKEEDHSAVVGITPVPGEKFGMAGADSGKCEWNYLDDRLWNRSYDDYQDLYGYYKVRQGIDTRNKYVYAHSYIYSPKECAAHLRVGASGSYRVFFNDRPVCGPTIPAEVKKDLTIQKIKLKAGWNKLLLQIQHTFTEDVNANGIPVGKDFHVAYLGFYGRITDPEGNRIDGLVYSLSGGQPKKLTIDTRSPAPGQDQAPNSLPDNAMPPAYTEWPYVWNDSPASDKSHAVSSSPFQFMAGGGSPGYLWNLESGTLPAGLKLNRDGTIDGFTEAEPGRYEFTVKVTDATGASTAKKFSIDVRERPNKWFEEGRVGALSHCIPIVNYFVDANYSADLWAERARRQGHSLVSIESLQQNYYWPSKFADPAHPRQQYLPKQADGRVVDGLRKYEQALRRYGIGFGLYYATEGGGLQHFSTDVFVQNVEDLILTYHPDYLYFDGPQAMPSANFDVMYSLIRNYSDKIIVNSNTNAGWGGAFGDADLRTVEASHIYSGANNNSYTKRTIMEPWKSVVSKHNPTPYYSKRDDFRQIVREMVMNAGRGMVDNNDQMPVMSRGTNWDTPEDVARRYPISVQEYIDIREGLAAWFAPDGKSERHESTTGTHPLFLAECGYENDGRGNIAQFEAGQGPAWGYAMARDNNIYLHILKGPDGKKGFDAINGRILTLSPITDKVEKVLLLNEDKEIRGFKQEGESLTLNLSGISEDPVDTIVKIVTDNKTRKYKLTNLYVTANQQSPSLLQIQVEGFMTYPALKTRLDKLSFRSDNPKVAAVNKNGKVQALSNGQTHITVTGIREGVEQTEKLPVKVSGGKIRVHDPLVGVVLKVGGKEIYDRIPATDTPRFTIEGRSRRGGPTGLHDAKITYYTGRVGLKSGTHEKPVNLKDIRPRHFSDGKMTFDKVTEKTRIAVWAEVELDGQKITGNKVFLDLEPWQNLARKAKISSSPPEKNYGPEKLADGQTINGENQDESRWSAPGNAPSWVAFDLGKPAKVQHMEIHYNTLEQKFHNVPRTLEIQTSTDGRNWKTEKSITPPQPSATAYWGHPEVYTFDSPVNARHIRLNFPDGATGPRLDLLEVVIAGQP